MVEKTVYKNKPILVISDDTKTYRKISFGINKAKLIIQNLEEIKKFIEDNKESRTPEKITAL